MVCGNCGKDSPDGSSVCVNCGAQLPQGVPPPPAPPHASPQAPPQGFQSPTYAPPKKATSPWIWAGVAAAGCLCTCPVFAAILFPVFAQARLAALRTVALSNAKQIALGTLVYANDNDDRFPPFTNSEDVTEKIGPYLRDPKLPSICAGYDWNTKLSAAKEFSVANPEVTWLFHTSAPDTGGKYIFGYVDGHCRSVGSQEYEGLPSAPTVILKDEAESKGIGDAGSPKAPSD